MMAEDSEITDLEQLLDQIEKSTTDGDRVSLGDVMEVVGGRSFGPILLLAGLITVAPGVGDIPGVPTIMAALVLLTAGQLLFGRSHLWLPQWLLRRSVARSSLCKTLKKLRPPARFVDKFLRPRLRIFTRESAIAIACVLIAASLPMMEVILFVANAAGAALTAFGLGLVARDGLLALLAFVATAATLGGTVYYFAGS